jgi:hypothetical protein
MHIEINKDFFCVSAFTVTYCVFIKIERYGGEFLEEIGSSGGEGR